MLIYNPTSGRNRNLREEQMRSVASAIAGSGHHVEVVPTISSGSAMSQAKAASASTDVIFACGGDGTIHEVMQALVSEEGNPTSTLGIIPLGSANALARHLRLSLDPRLAALQQIQGDPCTVPAGKIVYGDRVRYFAVMAGAGPDGDLTYSLLTSHKSRIGRFAYYLHAARLFAMRRFAPFEVESRKTASDTSVIHRAVGMMAVRIDNLGGVFSGLTSTAASIHDPAMQLVILKPPALISLPLWFLTGWLGARSVNPFLCTVNATCFTCRPLKDAAPHFQADGEWLGVLPFEARLIPNALRILLPNSAATKTDP